MRIFILLLLIPLNVFTQEIDWAKLNGEMEYLKENAFIDKKEAKEEKNEEVTQTVNTGQSAIKKNYSLRRKPKKPIDKDILPLEEQYFDNITFELSAPKRAKEKQFFESEKKPSGIKVDGSLPKGI